MVNYIYYYYFFYMYHFLVQQCKCGNNNHTIQHHCMNTVAAIYITCQGGCRRWRTRLSGWRRRTIGGCRCCRRWRTRLTGWRRRICRVFIATQSVVRPRTVAGGRRTRGGSCSTVGGPAIRARDGAARRVGRACPVCRLANIRPLGTSAGSGGGRCD